MSEEETFTASYSVATTYNGNDVSWIAFNGTVKKINDVCILLGTATMSAYVTTKLYFTDAPSWMKANEDGYAKFYVDYWSSFSGEDYGNTARLGADSAGPYVQYLYGSNSTIRGRTRSMDSACYAFKLLS